MRPLRIAQLLFAGIIFFAFQSNLIAQHNHGTQKQGQMNMQMNQMQNVINRMNDISKRMDDMMQQHQDMGTHQNMQGMKHANMMPMMKYMKQISGDMNNMTQQMKNMMDVLLLELEKQVSLKLGNLQILKYLKIIF